MLHGLGRGESLGDGDGLPIWAIASVWKVWLAANKCWFDGPHLAKILWYKSTQLKISITSGLEHSLVAVTLLMTGVPKAATTVCVSMFDFAVTVEAEEPSMMADRPASGHANNGASLGFTAASRSLELHHGIHIEPSE